MIYSAKLGVVKLQDSIMKMKIMNHNKEVLTMKQKILYIKILLVNQVAPLTNIDQKESRAQLRACYHHNLLQVELCLQRRILTEI